MRNIPITALMAKTIHPRVASRAARAGSVELRFIDMTAMTALGGPMIPAARMDTIATMSRMIADVLLGATVAAPGAG